ncbi:L-fuculose phosphate aldolase [Rhodobacteraceae bacterium THAF1]|uniref:class II aldolase/adducin family protein n=1 Tax=Palleronia sp. THAF1 TaxID=2587842 RepID=UPI000F406C2A|nr:class II aldolase/adducin family protein [Palleronia sp. THAF1]QFU08036.1 L-fuculose phosphate aldolase [Palleronia sp. THAF1]VDC27889.1 L-fuculose phosphate aldolase [Rhodobacteraceae bacterium THAF1]
MTPPYKDTTAVRQAVIDACLSMAMKGLNHGSSGNVSVRVDDTMLITPSGIAYDQMRPEMVATIKLQDGTASGPHKPSTEWHFHRALYHAKPGVHAVVHAHPTHATAQAMTRKPIPACTYMIAAFGGDDVRVAEYALFGTPALSDAVVAAMEGRQGCLMANHGAVVTGESLPRALWRMEELEALAKAYLLVGDAAHILSRAEIDETLAAFEDYGLKRLP